MRFWSYILPCYLEHLELRWNVCNVRFAPELVQAKLRKSNVQAEYLKFRKFSSPGLCYAIICCAMLCCTVIYGMRLFCSLNNLSSKIQSTSWAVYIKRCLVWYTAFNQYRSYFHIFQTTIYYTVVYHDLLWLAVIGFIGWCCAIVYDKIPILNSNLLTSRGVDSSDVTKSHDCAITSFQQQSVTPLLWTL